MELSSLNFFSIYRKPNKRNVFWNALTNLINIGKFSIDDLRERARWNDYHRAYEEALSATSASYAPWYVIPADDKWYTRLAIAGVIHRQLMVLEIDYPGVGADLRADLIKGRELLMKE